MTGLESALADYLALRRGLGHQLAEPARLLPRFVAWMDATGQNTVTVRSALEWVQQPEVGPDSTVPGCRMTAVRGFARYLSGIDPATEIPPHGLVPSRQRWKAPYIYTKQDIATLLQAAGRLRFGRDSTTYTVLFGLLAATGMRVSEVLQLDLEDVDLDAGVLTIRESKFGKSRHVPVHASTTGALTSYWQQRAEFRPQEGNASFLVSRTGRRLIYESVFSVFDHLRAETGIGAGAPRRPRIHDLRHTFAVTTLLGWYRDGQDVAGLLPRLSTYLGHREPRMTYWYLQAVPELLAHAAGRLEPIIGAVIPE
ncbi:tyrosine-type recombinase/integrase [Humibacter antri]